MKHLFTLDSLTNEQIISIVKEASVFSFSSGSTTTKPNGFVVGVLFFEPSTRTRYSFETATIHLGGKVLSFTGDDSTSTAKGETLYDTVKTFENFGIDALVIRHPEEKYYEKLQNINIPIISGGDGAGDHPTQSLLDLVTIYQEFGKLKGIKVAIIGDTFHSRVAKTNIKIMKRLGMEVVISGPQELCLDKSLHETLESAIATADVVMFLRVQLERHKEKINLSNKEYNKKFGLNSNNINLLKQKAIIMHPGPVNWGIELDHSIIDHPQTRINKQVTNGVAVRKILLNKVLKCK